MDQMRHKSGKAIVVSKTYLLIGYRIVLVDHWNDVHTQKTFERRSRMQVLTTVTKILWSQKYLPNLYSSTPKELRELCEQFNLPNRTNSLQHCSLGRSLNS
jgi:hypothetical protein